MTQREVAQKLRISLKTLKRWRQLGKIPFYQFGHRTIRFSSHEVEKFTKSHEQLAQISEVRREA